MSGGTPYANFKELAFAWGREKGFHHVLANAVCERRGEVERKKRSDAGRSMTEEEKLAFRSKLQKSKGKKGKKGDQETANEEEGQIFVHQHPPVAAVGGGEHGKTAELKVAVEGGPGVEETVVAAEVPMEAAGGVPESVGTVETPAPIHVAPAESTPPGEAEQQIAGEAHRSVTEI